MLYSNPNTPGALVDFKEKYDNYIGGKWTPPVNGEYFDDVTPVTGEVFTKAARSTDADIELALDAAHAAKKAWGATTATERSNILNKIADRIEANKEMLAVAETWENGKPVRETLNADIPLAADHFRYFASVIRAQEGTHTQIDQNTVSYHFEEPLGVVGQIIPWNFPLLMAAWKLAPALAAGNCVVMKPAEQTPVTIMLLMELIGDLLPPGVVNIVNGFGKEAGASLAQSTRIAKIAFTGSTPVGKQIMRYAAENIIPITLELGGKSANIFFKDVMDQDDDFLDKALEGLAMFALNSGEVCTCPSRALVHEDIYEKFMEKALERVKKIKMGNPLDTDTMLGAQNSKQQHDKILGYIDIGKEEGAELLTGGEKEDHLGGDLNTGYYVKPTVFKGLNDMRIFQEEIFGPVLSVTTFKDFDEAMAIANDTEFGLGAGVWTRSGDTAYKAGRALEAGRIWTNTYHQYPAGSTFGGFKQSGIGRETHSQALDHYQQTKSLLVSYNEKPLGFF